MSQFIQRLLSTDTFYVSNLPQMASSLWSLAGCCVTWLQGCWRGTCVKVYILSPWVGLLKNWRLRQIYKLRMKSVELKGTCHISVGQNSYMLHLRDFL